jgi:hypothetical protein
MAYRKIGAIAEDETPTAGMYEDAAFALNAMVKEWMATGIHVWTEEEAILFFQKGQRRYLLGGAGPGGTGPDNCCDVNAYALMQLTSAAVAGNTTINVDGTVGVANGNFLGIVLDTGFAFWTTVSGAPGLTTVNLAAPLPSSVSAQNSAFAYATKIVRPLQVPRCRQIFYQGGLSGPRLTPMSVLSRKEYMDLPQPDDPGISTQFFYTPQLVSGEFYAWPNPQNATFGARLTWYRPIMDINTPANTLDFPQEWINACGWNLAREIGPEYAVPPQVWQIVVAEAEKKLELAQNYDRESEPIYFGIGFDETQR